VLGQGGDVKQNRARGVAAGGPPADALCDDGEGVACAAGQSVLARFAVDGRFWPATIARFGRSEVNCTEGQHVTAVWAGDGLSLPAVIAKIDTTDRQDIAGSTMVTVTWDPGSPLLEWVDLLGSDCVKWGEQSLGRVDGGWCEVFGDKSFFNADGISAKRACCACGGGIRDGGLTTDHVECRDTVLNSEAAHRCAVPHVAAAETCEDTPGWNDPAHASTSENALQTTNDSCDYANNDECNELENVSHTTLAYF
jgi:hypothetical protein